MHFEVEFALDIIRIIELNHFTAHRIKGVVHHGGNPDAAVHVVLGQLALTVDAKLQAAQAHLLLRTDPVYQTFYLLLKQLVEPLGLRHRQPFQGIKIRQLHMPSRGQPLHGDTQTTTIGSYFHQSLQVLYKPNPAAVQSMRPAFPSSCAKR